MEDHFEHLKTYELNVEICDKALNTLAVIILIIVIACRACESTELNRTYSARERVYGLPGTFTYGECKHCRSLNLDSPPTLSDYYPTKYYSAAGPSSRLLRSTQSAIDRLAWLAPWLVPGYDILSVMKRFGIKKGARVLDVGSGSGRFLERLIMLGFKQPTGIDPYFGHARVPGVDLRATEIRKVEEHFDTIIFSHSLEHVPTPFDELREAEHRLTEDGVVIVETPIVAYAWRRFQTDWFQLDAPRHTVIFTEQGFRILAKRAGLRITNLLYRSDASQFWKSELLREGRILSSEVPKTLSPTWWGLRTRHLPRSIQSWWLNRIGEGDTAAFLLGRA